MVTRILIVDDEPAIRLILPNLIESLGHHVAAVASGRDALAALAETPFDVVLCDLRMPGMTGIEVWEQVRASACVPPAAVLMTAAVEGARLAAQHGMAFLEKPFNFETLRATIDAAIATRGPPVR